MSDELHIGDWIPEILAVLVFGAVYSLLVYQWFLGEISSTGTAMMWIGFVLSVIVLFGVDRIKQALSVTDGYRNNDR